MNKLNKIVLTSAVISGIILTSYIGKCIQNYSQKENIRNPDYIHVVKPIKAFGKIDYEKKKEDGNIIEKIIETELFSSKEIKLVNNKFASCSYSISNLFGESWIINNDPAYFNEQATELKNLKEIKRKLDLE